MCTACRGESSENYDHDAETCEECIDGYEHKIAYTKAQMEYQEEFPDGFNLICMPLISRRLLLSIKESFFASRHIVFNETFARLGADHEPDSLGGAVKKVPSTVLTKFH